VDPIAKLVPLAQTSSYATAKDTTSELANLSPH